ASANPLHPSDTAARGSQLSLTPPWWFSAGSAALAKCCGCGITNTYRIAAALSQGRIHHVSPRLVGGILSDDPDRLGARRVRPSRWADYPQPAPDVPEPVGRDYAGGLVFPRHARCDGEDRRSLLRLVDGAGGRRPVLH